MKRRVLTSIAASVVVIGALALSGCGSSTKTEIPETPDTNPTPSQDTSVNIKIKTESGTKEVDPRTGGTVVINRNNTNNTNTVATVVHSELNECASVDTSGSGVKCGPKSGVTYVFQSDFGKLGPVDNDPTTPDGGVLLYDALTEYNGVTFDTPVEGNQSENRIQEVYIPANYIVLGDDDADKSVNEKYEMMREYLANVCNMKCFAQEDNASMSNNPFFVDGKDEGKFVATFVMHFTRGTGEDTLMQKFNSGDKTDLEYLTVTFELDVKKESADSRKLRFTSPAGSAVTFGAKKAGEGGLTVTTTNDVINSVLHETPVDLDNALTINMAKYFDKLIAKGDALGVSGIAKEILVENAQHPWPVKIYGTLHEITDSGYDRSFVRNPAKLNASLFGLDDPASEYKDAFNADENKKGQAIKFNIVYPGGDYNKLD